MSPVITFKIPPTRKGHHVDIPPRGKLCQMLPPKITLYFPVAEGEKASNSCVPFKSIFPRPQIAFSFSQHPVPSGVSHAQVKHPQLSHQWLSSPHMYALLLEHMDCKQSHQNLLTEKKKEQTRRKTILLLTQIDDYSGGLLFLLLLLYLVSCCSWAFFILKYQRGNKLLDEQISGKKTCVLVH